MMRILHICPWCIPQQCGTNGSELQRVGPTQNIPPMIRTEPDVLFTQYNWQNASIAGTLQWLLLVIQKH